VIAAILKQLRPKQWSKNLILFAGLIFAEQMRDPDLFIRAVLGFVCFALVSSAVYCFNDLVDLANDKRHPEKRHRPLPSGAISPQLVFGLGLVLMAVGVLGAFQLAPNFGLVTVVYFLQNLAYSLKLKQVPVLDIILLSAGFVLRAVGSVEVLARPDVQLSPWLILCTFFLALFISAGKRRAELALLADDAGTHRAALSGYSLAFLDRILGSTMTSAVLAYAIYTLAPETQAKFGTTALVYTVPFVLFGLYRYMYLVYEKDAGGNPTESIIQDRPLILDVASWLFVVTWVLYVR
jgi:4-hydroxybenzoate polyprenyltransferase